MKYERLTVINERGDSVVFDVHSKYWTNVSFDVVGLSDVKNAIYSTASIGQSGSTFVGQNLLDRTIQISGTIWEKDKDLYIEARRRLTQIFNPEFPAQLFWEYKEDQRRIHCYVANAPVFKRVGAYIKFTIQIQCLDPYWYDEESFSDIATWSGMFTFPLEIDDEIGYEFETRAQDAVVEIENAGEAMTGMTIEFRAIGAVTNPKLINADNSAEYIKINTSLVAGDVVTVNTKWAGKSAKLLRQNIEDDVFRLVDVDSTFMQLPIGVSRFLYAADGGEDQLNVSIRHTDKYLGV